MKQAPLLFVIVVLAGAFGYSSLKLREVTVRSAEFYLLATERFAVDKALANALRAKNELLETRVRILEKGLPDSLRLFKEPADTFTAWIELPWPWRADSTGTDSIGVQSYRIILKGTNRYGLDDE